MIINILISTFLSLKAHKIRVFLTMVGIIIGITSVVTISTLGEGMKQQVLSATESNSSKNLKITYDIKKVNYSDRDFNFSLVDLKKIKGIDGIDSILPNYGRQDAGDAFEQELDYYGSKVNLLVSPYKSKIEIKYGRNFEPSDVNFDRIILSHSVFDDSISMDNPSEMINQAILVGGYMFKVIGITAPANFKDMSLQDTFSNVDYFSEYKSYISKASYNNLSKSKAINGINLKLKSDVNRDEIVGKVVSLLEELYPDVEGHFKEDDFNQQIQNQSEEAINGMTGFLMAITLISLLVGGIGVMNIMYVSVIERKREIGIRRAIGAKPRSILIQFLLEAIFITLLGGLIGIGLAYGISTIVGGIVQIKPVMTTQIFLISLLVSISTGIFFGIIPAINASRIDPIKAIYR